MTILHIEVEEAKPVAVHCDEKSLTVTLADGRVLQAPLWWYPRLYKAPAGALQHVELSAMGMRWPDVDEDISVASMLRGAKPPGGTAPGASPTGALGSSSD